MCQPTRLLSLRSTVCFRFEFKVRRVQELNFNISTTFLEGDADTKIAPNQSNHCRDIAYDLYVFKSDSQPF